MLAAQQVLPTDLIWNDQMPDWATVESVFPTATPVPAPIPAPIPMPTPVAMATPVAAAGKSTVKPTENPAAEAKPDKTESGKKSSLPKIGAIVGAGLVVIGVALWFFVLRGEPETEDSKIIKTAIRKSINKPSGDLSQSDYNKVKSLELSSKNLADVSLLEKLDNVEELNLAGNNIADLEPLKELVKLKVLNLAGNQIEGLDPLKGLTQLEVLHLGGNKIKDAGALADFKNLIDLDLGSNELESVEHFLTFSNLEVLNLSGNQIKNLVPMERVKSLKVLLINANPGMSEETKKILAQGLPECVFPD